MVCDGLCRVAFSVVNSNANASVKICPVWQEAFELAVNCEASENPCFFVEKGGLLFAFSIER